MKVDTPTTTVQIQQTTPTVQKIVTSPMISGQTQTITSSNLQQLLQRGAVAGQKIIVNPSPVGVQKVLVTQTGQQQIGEKRIIIQSPGAPQQQQIILNRGAQFIPTSTAAVGQQIIVGNQKYVLSPVSGQQSTQPQTTTTQVQTQQISQPIQFKIQQSPQIQEQPKTQQIVVQNSSIAQQLAEGKIQLANFNGQQVLIKQIGNGQAQIVGHVKSGNQTQIPVVQSQPQSPQTTVQQSPQQQIIKTQFVQSTPTQSVTISPQQQPQVVTRQIQIPQTVTQIQPDDQQISAAVEQSLLAGQPPGTIIKCVTAQVVQTANGPRIVLQGLQGSDFTAQQTQLVQQQVKQQLLKGLCYKFSF